MKSLKFWGKKSSRVRVRALQVQLFTIITTTTTMQNQNLILLFGCCCYFLILFLNHVRKT